MQALKVGDNLTLVFSKVVDELVRGAVDEDEDAEAAPTDRPYWEARATRQTVQLVDELLEVARTFDQSLTLKYNKFYIGLARDGQPYNFVLFRPRKKTINVEIALPRTSETDALLEASGIDTLEYSTQWGRYRLSLDREVLGRQQNLLRELFGHAYQEQTT